MPLLVLLNGGPASGKSTIARRWIADRPLALALDIDVVRSMLGAWEDDAFEAGLAARRLAIEMTRRHLSKGHDVVIPQFLGESGIAFIEQLQAVAAEADSAFVEVALSVAPEVADRRFSNRAARAKLAEADTTTHGPLDAETMLEVAEAHRRFIATREMALIVETIDGDIEESTRRVAEAIAKSTSNP
jgi:predicted kinase